MALATSTQLYIHTTRSTMVEPDSKQWFAQPPLPPLSPSVCRSLPQQTHRHTQTHLYRQTGYNNIICCSKNRSDVGLYLHIELGSEIRSQVITGDVFRMDSNTRCELTYPVLSIYDQIPQHRFYTRS